MRESQLSATSKKYIEVQYDEDTQHYLRQYCIDNEFDLSVKFDGKDQSPQMFDFHSTVWYTTNETSINNGTQDVQITDITSQGFALFGPDENILVLEIDSEQIRSIRATLGSEYGLEDEWPDYRPHITVSYSFSGDLPSVPLPDGDQMTATKLNVKNQK
jgi:hypothetical protein